MQDDTSQLKQFANIMHNFPLGSYIWHRADGRRGVIIGYLILGYSVLIRVSYGAEETNEVPLVLSSGKITAADSGEEWQQTE